MKKRIAAAALVFTLLLSGSAGAVKEYTLTLDASKTGVDISDIMYGLFYEDINHAADGGIYPELVNNRSFEYAAITNSKDSDGFNGWIINYLYRGKGNVAINTQSPLNESNPRYLTLDITASPYTIINNGYTSSVSQPQMGIKSGVKYNFSFYVRSNSFKGKIDVSVQNEKREDITNVESFTVKSKSEWTKYEGSFTAAATENGRLVIVLNGEGEIDLDFISLMPTDTWGYGESTWKYGGLRKDLVEALKALSPKFIRFPGGCIVEGAFTHDTHYDWKDTIGDPIQRDENPNLWGYMQSYGLGYHEYFQLCADLKAEPVPIIHAGLLCQARGNAEADWVPGDPEFDQLIQDILDLIEYANGDTSTQWGAKRAENGQPEPFNLKYIGIGNENWESRYWLNFFAIKQAVLEVYPDMNIISSTGPLADGWINDYAWTQIKLFHKDTIVDEHYYMSPQWFLDNTHRYDSYDRNSAKIFLGEYAAHADASGGRRPNTLFTALAEAAYMTGLERNADIVIMASYAPLFARKGMDQWTPDMIWFDQYSVTFTPNYYVQRMFAGNIGKQTLVTELKDEEIFHSASIDKDNGKLYLKLVNPTEETAKIDVSLEGLEELSQQAEIILLADSDHRSTIAAPQTFTAQITDSAVKTVKIDVPAYCAQVVTFSFKAENPDPIGGDDNAEQTIKLSYIIIAAAILLIGAVCCIIILTMKRRGKGNE